MEAKDMRKSWHGIAVRILFALLVAGFFIVGNIPASKAQCSVNLLILGDGTSEGQITPFLPSNISWTLAPVTEYNYNGANPSLVGFDVVLLLDGASPAYNYDMPTSGQTALVNFVQNGGGFIGTAWLPYERGYGRYASMAQLVPLTRITGHETTDTYTVVVNHPVTAGLPSSFSVPQAGYDVASANSGTVVITGANAQDAVVVKQYGSGRVVGLATAAGYYTYNPWNANMQTLLINAIEWAAGCQPLTQNKRANPPSLLPLANTHLSQANALMTQVNDLLSQAKTKNLDTASCEKLIDEANEFLREAKLRKASPATANYFALQAIKKLNQGIDCLKALLGLFSDT
jgi:hypothetical protein